MPNNCLSNALSLLFRGPEVVFQEIEREETAIEFEAEVRGMEVLVRGADVVQEAGEEVGLVAELPGGEVGVAEGLAWKTL